MHLQIATWVAAVDRIKAGSKCGALYVQAKELKAGLLDKLDAVRKQMLDILEA